MSSNSKGCIADNDVCHWPNPSRNCCSDFCLAIPNATSGYCTSPPSTNRPFVNDEHSALKIFGIIGVIIAVFMVILIPFCIFILFRKYMKRKKRTYLELGQINGLSKAEIERFLQGNPEQVQINKQAHEMVEDMPYDRRYEIPEKAFIIDEKDILGSGAFGLVIRGKLWKQDVAIKTIKPNAEKSYVRALLTELKVLIHIGEHENIVSLLGAYTSNLKAGTLYLFLELCGLGNLLEYLRTHRESFQTLSSTAEYENIEEKKQPLIKKDLLRWSAQIANGLRFLSDKKVIHGDIATRNILLISREQAKLTDFGLSRRLYEYTNYVKKQQEPLPWRWMSIEALRDLTFSTQSDTWSFGVTLWEIFSLGEVPYPGLTWSQHFIYKLLDGYRLVKPIHAEDDLYELMNACWKTQPTNRPTFHDIYTNLTEMNSKY